jgi:hypothetical protein
MCSRNQSNYQYFQKIYVYQIPLKWDKPQFIENLQKVQLDVWLAHMQITIYSLEFCSIRFEKNYLDVNYTY